MSYANWGQRAGGYLIDVFIVTIPMLLGYIPVLLTMDDGTPAGIGMLLAFVGWAIGMGLGIYNRWILGGGTGQTWGRKVLGIRLVSAQTGQPIGAGMAFVRDLCHAVDGLPCYIGWLFPLWDSKGQTLADKILNTIVVTDVPAQGPQGYGY